MLLRKSAFDIIEERDFHFKHLLRTSPAMRRVLCEVHTKWPDFLAKILPKMTTVFQLSVVRHRASGKVLVVSNTHLFFHPLARHIRLLQAMCLLEEAQALREKHRDANGGELPRVIFAGDLNTKPGTGVADLLLKGEVPSTHSDWEFSTQFAWRDADEESMAEDDACKAMLPPDAPAEIEDADGCSSIDILAPGDLQPGQGVDLRNPLGALSDAYADTGLEFTNYVNGFNAVLDYILMAGGWRVAGVLQGISEEDLKPDGGLPNAKHPSDHLTLAADLQMV